MTPHTILWLSVIDWDAAWDGQQALALRLAREGHTVTFVETPGVRSVERRDWGRLTRRLRNRLRGGVRGFQPLADNLWLLSPVLLPFPGRTWADRINKGLMTFSLRRLPAAGPEAPLMVWTFLPTPLAVQVVQKVRPDRLVYYCVNDVVQNPSGAAPGTVEAEQWLVRRATHVFVTSKDLAGERKRLNPRTTYLPAGADVAPFLRSWPEPGDLARLPRPRICFFGTLDVWLDQDLLIEVATTFSNASLVLIGPVRWDVSRLLARPNVHWLGPRPHDALPAYLHHVDLCLIPYRITPYTRTIHPVKTYEALATGKPLVATALPELEQYSELVTVAEDASAFLRGIAESLAETDPLLAERRREIARQNTWDARYRLIQEKLPELAP